MTSIVVSRRDGILRAPDGTKYRVARGKTLAEADHPAVLANPGDWVPMVVALVVDGREPSDAGVPASHERVAQLENDVAELEETLAGRDAELARLAEGLAGLSVDLPAEDDREPGWLVDLVLDEIVTARADPRWSAKPEPLAAVAPPKPRKRTGPPVIVHLPGNE
jgi:hypothetical protein